MDELAETRLMVGLVVAVRTRGRSLITEGSEVTRAAETMLAQGSGSPYLRSRLQQLVAGARGRR